MARLKRFEDFRFVGAKDTMRVYDCDDEDQLKRLQVKVERDDLLGRNLLQAFGPDSLEEAANRGFTPPSSTR